MSRTDLDVINTITNKELVKACSRDFQDKTERIVERQHEGRIFTRTKFHRSVENVGYGNVYGRWIPDYDEFVYENDLLYLVPVDGQTETEIIYLKKQMRDIHRRLDVLRGEQ